MQNDLSLENNLQNNFFENSNDSIQLSGDLTTVEKKVSHFIDFIQNLEINEFSCEKIFCFINKELKKWETVISLNLLIKINNQYNLFHYKNDFLKVYLVDMNESSQLCLGNDQDLFKFKMMLEKKLEYPISFLHFWKNLNIDENTVFFIESRRLEFSSFEMKKYLNLVSNVFIKVIFFLNKDFNQISNIDQSSLKVLNEADFQQYIKNSYYNWKQNLLDLTHDFENIFFKKIIDFNKVLLFFKENNNFYLNSKLKNSIEILEKNNKFLFFDLIKSYKFFDQKNLSFNIKDVIDHLMLHFKDEKKNSFLFDIKSAFIKIDHAETWYILYQIFSLFFDDEIFQNNSKIYTYLVKDQCCLNIENTFFSNNDLISHLISYSINIDQINNEIEYRLFLIQNELKKNKDIEIKTTNKGIQLVFNLNK